MRVLELADTLRARGLVVVEVAGWQTRGREFPSRPDICIRHWTAGPPHGQTPSLQVVTNGHSKLRGPLCQIYQSREADGNDRIFVIASGVANHAGVGTWAGVSGNSKSMGLEIEWSGPQEAFSPRERQSASRRWPRSCSALWARTVTTPVSITSMRPRRGARSTRTSTETSSAGACASCSVESRLRSNPRLRALLTAGDAGPRRCCFLCALGPCCCRRMTSGCGR